MFLEIPRFVDCIFKSSPNHNKSHMAKDGKKNLNTRVLIAEERKILGTKKAKGSL